MNSEHLDYGVLENDATGQLVAVRIIGTTIGYIITEYAGSRSTYDPNKWNVVYRDATPDYTGPTPDYVYRWK
jgi:hypothetical protein